MIYFSFSVAFTNIFFFLTLVEAAGSSRGLYSSRKTNTCEGFQLYYGTRGLNSQNRPSPSEGPNEHGKYQYHRDSMSHLRWPFLASCMSTLSQIATYAAAHVYKFLYVLYPNKNKRKDMLFCRIGIFTMDFSCTPHTDQNDKALSSEESVLHDLDVILECEHVNQQRKKEATSASSFVKHWGLGVPTTCCYQYVNHQTKKCTPIQFFHYFCMQGIDLCRRIHNYWTHTFLAYTFVHGTSVPIYVSNGLVFVGKHPEMTMLAWGGSGS
jgi:hypothetical protein